MADIDPSGTLAVVLDVPSGEVWVIRLERLHGRGAGPGEKARAAPRALGNRGGSEPGWWTPAEPVGV